MENDSVGQAPSPAKWWVAEKKGAAGPFPLEELRRRITLESWVWRPGWEDWRKATTLCEADLAETDENRAFFGGAPLFQPKPPPRGMFLNNLWLWGLLVLPLLGLFVFGIVLGVVLGEEALMEFGALYCVPRSPQCGGCVFADRCLAFATGRVESLPVKQGRTVVKPRYFNYFYVRHGADTWVRRREGRDIWRNLYELPLIETDEEQSLDTLQQSESWASLFAEAGQVSVSAQVYTCKHVLSHRVIHARFYVVETENSPSMKGYTRIDSGQIGHYAVSRLTEGFLERLSTNYPSLF